MNIKLSDINIPKCKYNAKCIEFIMLLFFFTFVSISANNDISMNCVNVKLT